MKIESTTKFISTFSEYAIIKLCGEGGNGFVYEVMDKKGQHYALKVLKPERVTDEIRGRFKNEILFCEQKRHPNIISIMDHGVIIDGKNQIPFYVMPLYSYSLRHGMNGEILYNSILPLFSQILDGIEAAHLFGVIHRDIKPENILLEQSSRSLVIADFGIALFQQEELFTAVETRASERLANFVYAAPEQRVRGQVVEKAADIYALGLILSELFTKSVPLGSGYKTISSVAPEYSYLDPIVDKMIRFNPSERPASIGEIKRELSERGKIALSEQQLSRTKQIIIPETEIDDPLVTNPITLSDFDWDGHRLTLILSQTPPTRWLTAFQNMGSYSSLMGKDPKYFTFQGNKAIIPAEEGQIPTIVSHFKEWLISTTKKYKEILLEEKRQKEISQREKLAASIAREEAMLRLRKNIKL